MTDNMIPDDPGRDQAMTCRLCATAGHEIADDDMCPACRETGLGSADRPHADTPKFFEEQGLPYAAWCRCSRCGRLDQSTIAFDFYDRGGKLVCENCMIV